MEGSEESDPERRMWDSMVNMYVVSDTDEEEGSQEGEADIPSEGLSDHERIDRQCDKYYGCRAASRSHAEEDCSEEEALSETTDSLQVIRVTRGRDQTGTNTTIRVLPRNRAGMRGTERKRSCCH